MGVCRAISAGLFLATTGSAEQAELVNARVAVFLLGTLEFFLCQIPGSLEVQPTSSGKVIFSTSPNALASRVQALLLINGILPTNW